MAQRNYNQILTDLKNLEPFTGNSMSARWNGEVYTIRSYGTVIATAVQAGHLTTFNEAKYSVTTSRHQNLVRRAFNLV